MRDIVKYIFCGYFIKSNKSLRKDKRNWKYIFFKKGENKLMHGKFLPRSIYKFTYFAKLSLYIISYSFFQILMSSFSKICINKEKAI